jgi:hypothetical protein
LFHDLLPRVDWLLTAFFGLALREWRYLSTRAQKVARQYLENGSGLPAALRVG